MSPTTPTTLMQPLAGAPTPFLHVPDVMSPILHAAPSRSETTLLPRPTALPPPDATSPSALLRSRILELDRLGRLLWRQMESPAQGRIPVLQSFYNASIVNQTPSARTGHDRSSDLRSRINVLESLAIQLWTNVNEPWQLDEDGVEALRQWASAVLGDYNDMPAAQSPRPQILESPISSEIQAYTANVAPGFQPYPTPVNPAYPYPSNFNMLATSTTGPSQNITPDFSDTSQSASFAPNVSQMVYYPYTQGDSTDVPRLADRQDPKRLRSHDSDYGTGVDETGSPLPAGRPWQ